MEPIRKHTTVENGQIILPLPGHLNHSEVDVIIFPKHFVKKQNISSALPKRRLGKIRGTLCREEIYENE